MKLFLKFIWQKGNLKNSENEEVVNKYLTDLSLDEESFSILKDNLLHYICGFVVKSIFKKTDCKMQGESLLEVQVFSNYK